MESGYQFAGRALTRVSRAIRRIGHIGDSHAHAATPQYRDYFSISIYTGASPLDLAPAAGACLPVLTGKDVTDIAAAYVADPFMIRVDGCWYMYFEILPAATAKGVIGLATSRDGLKWSYQKVVLEEPYHLSYPCVFESNGSYFMIPESNQAGTVRLYKADRFPDRWTFVANLLENVEYVDCTPFQFGDRWWLFAGGGDLPLRADTLRLFHTDRLKGTWIEHPASPLIENNLHIARPGGRVVIWDKRLFRFSQDCSPRYGLRIHAFEITELTESSYRERPAADGPILKESLHGWNASGMHHMDFHLLEDGTGIACVDGWAWLPVKS